MGQLHGCAKALRGCECEACRVVPAPLMVSHFQHDEDEVSLVVCDGREEKLLVANGQLMCVCAGGAQRKSYSSKR